MGIACTHPSASILHLAGAVYNARNGLKKMRKRDAHDSWAKTEKLLQRASALDRAFLATGEDGRGSDVLDNWLASLTNHE